MLKHKTEEEMKKDKQKCENCDGELEFLHIIFEPNDSPQRQNMWKCKRCRHFELFANATGERIDSNDWN